MECRDAANFAAAARIGWNKIGFLPHRSSTNPKVVKVRSQSEQASTGIGSPTTSHFPRLVGGAEFLFLFYLFYLFFFFFFFFMFLLFFLSFSSCGFYSGRAGYIRIRVV